MSKVDNHDHFWQEILPDIRASLSSPSGGWWEKYSEITENYIRGIEWIDASEHEQAIVAGNIREFSYNVMRVLLVIAKEQRRMESERAAELTAEVERYHDALEYAKEHLDRTLKNFADSLADGRTERCPACGCPTLKNSLQTCCDFHGSVCEDCWGDCEHLPAQGATR